MLQRSKGFTIVELIVVILVIGILASVVIVSYASWRQITNVNVVKNDLKAVVSAMEDKRNFSGSGYSAAIPSSVQPSSTTILNGGGRAGGSTYCVAGTSTADPTIKYYVSDKQKEPAVGDCTITVTQVAAISFRMEGVAIANDGTAYVPDDTNYVVKMVSPAGVVSTFAGTGTRATVNGPAATSQFMDPRGTAIAADGSVYVADINGNTIRKISPTLTVSTFSQSSVHATDVTVGTDGNIYALEGDNVAGSLYSLGTTGVATKLVGGATNATIDGQGLAASLNDPRALTQTQDGTIYICENATGLIRKVTTTAAVSTYAGPSSAYAGGATSPLAGWCTGVAAGPRNSLYVSAGGVLQTISQDGTVATLATVSSGMSGLATNSSGNIWASSSSGLWKITLP